MTEHFEFAGNRMRLDEKPDGSATLTFDDVGTGRVCGDCQLCCKLVPVRALNKPGGKKCHHQKVGKGCQIYVTRPRECQAWSCRWLSDPAASGLKRPDRAHYVIDLMWDTVDVNDGENSGQLPALQIWIDDAYPHAHRDPALRQYLHSLSLKSRCIGIVRYSNKRRDFVLIPPNICDDGEWHETPGLLRGRDL